MTIRGKPNTFLTFFAYFIPFYFIATLCVWAFINIQTYNYTQSATESFIKNDSNAVYNKVFTEAFFEGKKCLLIINELSRSQCHIRTKNFLANALHEEELLAYDEDLMFVQRDDGKLYSLGWSGEVRDITHEANLSDSSLRAPQLFFFLTRQCHYFKLYDQSQWGCEVYQPVRDSASTLGYVVRLKTFTEETWISSVLFSPLILLLTFHDLRFFLSPFAVSILFMILIPVVLATWMVKRRQKK